jgi:hypothetical protein
MIPINIRVPESLHAKLQKTAEAMDLPIADVVRHAIALGISDLELIGPDLDRVLHAAVLQLRGDLSARSRPPDPGASFEDPAG